MHPFPSPRAPFETTAAQPRQRDACYVLGYHGFIYAGMDLSGGDTQRHSAALLLSCDHRSFTVTLPDGGSHTGPALLVPPLVNRSLQACGIPLLSFNVLPSHPRYHSFIAAQHSGVLAFMRQAFDGFDDEMAALLAGELVFHRAEGLFEAVIAEACAHLPPVPAPDPAALEVIRLLDENPQLSVDDLARKLGRSTQSMSRLFSSAVGMSARDYQGWLKLRRMSDVLYTASSLTDVAYAAGFSDSPQFTRTFQRWYGKLPSYARDAKNVRVFIRGAELPAAPQAPG